MTFSFYFPLFLPSLFLFLFLFLTNMKFMANLYNSAKEGVDANDVLSFPTESDSGRMRRNTGLCEKQRVRKMRVFFGVLDPKKESRKSSIRVRLYFGQRAGDRELSLFGGHFDGSGCCQVVICGHLGARLGLNAHLGLVLGHLMDLVVRAFFLYMYTYLFVHVYVFLYLYLYKCVLVSSRLVLSCVFNVVVAWRSLRSSPRDCWN